MSPKTDLFSEGDEHAVCSVQPTVVLCKKYTAVQKTTVHNSVHYVCISFQRKPWDFKLLQCSVLPYDQTLSD